MTEPTHTPLPYECFQDRSYYDMWCVRRVNEREWGKGFHLVNGEEAAALRDMLNTRADSHHRLVEALREIQRATIEGRVCDDVAWFDQITTLHDYIEEVLRPSQPAAIGDLFPETAALKEAGRG